LAVAAKKLDPNYVPDLKLTSPVFQIGPYPSWSDPKKISGEYIENAILSSVPYFSGKIGVDFLTNCFVAALDPFGHMVTQVYGDWLDKGWWVHTKTFKLFCYIFLNSPFPQHAGIFVQLLP
jgi:hypothetical protein